ncbi:MAG: hypothetical protein J0I18_04820 [Actinobacteria bacterium]|nr:hypothetical protein [Actinomycetota bacterium]
MPDKNGLTPSQYSSVDREKKVYPPIQWWPLRLTSPTQKVAVLVVWIVAGVLVRWALDLVASTAAVSDLWVILDTVAIVAFARSCRGWSEPVAPPRAWWRLTARPLAGWWLAGLHLFAVAAPFVQGRPLEVDLAGITSLFLGLAFLNSSIRLTPQRHRTP